MHSTLAWSQNPDMIPSVRYLIPDITWSNGLHIRVSSFVEKQITLQPWNLSFQKIVYPVDDNSSSFIPTTSKFPVCHAVGRAAAFVIIFIGHTDWQGEQILSVLFMHPNTLNSLSWFVFLQWKTSG